MTPSFFSLQKVHKMLFKAQFIAFQTIKHKETEHYFTWVLSTKTYFKLIKVLLIKMNWNKE